MSGRISKQSIYGQNQIPETQHKIGRIREALGDSARQQKDGSKFRQQNYPLRKNEIIDVVTDLRIRYKSISPLKDTDYFDDGEFYGFRGDFAQNKERWPEEMEIEIECQPGIIDTYGNDTEEWKEAHMEYEKLKRRIRKTN